MSVPGVMQLKGKIQENPQMWPIRKRTTDCLAVSQCNTSVQYRHVVICEAMMIVDTGLSFLYTTFGDVEEDSVYPPPTCPRVRVSMVAVISVFCV